MAVTGVFASNQHIVGNRLGDFAGAVLQIFPEGTSPLLALSSGMQDESAKDTVVNWFEETKIAQRAQVTANATSTATTIYVDDGTPFVNGVLLMNENTGEYIRVTASSGVNPTTLTVVRGHASTTKAAMTATTDHLTRVGNAHEEGSSMPTAVTNQGHSRTNYTQIFRTAWSVTGTLKAVEVRTGDQVRKNKSDAMFFHAEDMERAFWWGKKFVDSLNGKPFHGMDGLEAQITQYGGLIDVVSGGNVSSKYFRDFQRQIFRYNVKGQPNERLAFAGDKTVQVLAEAAGRDGDHKITSVETDFGLKFTKFHSPFGSLALMTHPLFVENPLWQNSLYVIHPGGIKKKTLRKTNSEGYDSNGNRIQGKDQDEGVITTEVTMECMAPVTMGIMTNITTDVASYT